VRELDINWKPGGTLGDCQRCGFTRRLNDLKLEWSGLRVCFDTCWDPRPDTLTAPVVYPEGLPRPDAAPEYPDVFVTGNGPTPGDL
jgi:hypothetical protein